MLCALQYFTHRVTLFLKGRSFVLDTPNGPVHGRLVLGVVGDGGHARPGAGRKSNAHSWTKGYEVMTSTLPNPRHHHPPGASSFHHTTKRISVHRSQCSKAPAFDGPALCT
jgi:hypothetical protein